MAKANTQKPSKENKAEWVNGNNSSGPGHGELKTMFVPDIETKVKYGFSASAADKTKEQNSKIVISKRADGNLQLIDAEDPQMKLPEV